MATEVAIGVLIDRKTGPARVLIARRRPDQALGGYWELPGGKIEVGETPKQCLEREFGEELGVGVSVGQALEAVEHDYEHEYFAFYANVYA